jgi:CDGSH-type Zn-finger protein
VIEATENGPLVVRGAIEVKDAAGRVTPKEGATSFCRCGSSANKPFCDGSHSRVGFQG